MEIWIEPYYRIRDGRVQLVRGHFRARRLSKTSPFALGLVISK